MVEVLVETEATNGSVVPVDVLEVYFLARIVYNTTGSYAPVTTQWQQC